jgi:hypothetical protein
MEVKFGTWNARGPYRAMKAVASELTTCNLDIREIKWEGVDWMHLV